MRVYEIGNGDSGSKVLAGKALYVVEIPDSDRAPHQSREDRLYYVRLGGRSLPAPHKLIEDIRNRQRHPNVILEERAIEEVWVPLDNMPEIKGSMQIRLRFRVRNDGRLKAGNACLSLELHERGASFGDYSLDLLKARQDTQHRCFWELRDPLYPEMGIGFWIAMRVHAELQAGTPTIPGSRRWFIAGKLPQEFKISWRLFADNAPVKEGEFNAAELDFEGIAFRSIPDERMKKYYGLF